MIGNPNKQVDTLKPHITAICEQQVKSLMDSHLKAMEQKVQSRIDSALANRQSRDKEITQTLSRMDAML